jgi:hypothetical protein
MSAAQLQVRHRHHDTAPLHTRFTTLPGASQQTQARKLQALKDKLVMRTEDIAHTKTVVGKEGIELNARKEQRDKVCERIVGVLKEMDMEAAARADAKVPPPPSRPIALCWAAPHRTAPHRRHHRSTRRQCCMRRPCRTRRAHRMRRTRRTRRAPQAEKDAAAAEEEYLRDALAAILQTEVEELRLGLQKRADEAANEALQIEDGTVQEVSVIFETEEARPPPPRRPRHAFEPCTHHAHIMHEPCPHQTVFRVNDTYTFESLKSDTCRYFEVHPLDMLLSDDQNAEWPGDRYVRSELERLENTYGRVFLKFLSREEDELGEDPEDLLALLAGEEEPEEEAKPAAVAAAGATIAPLTEQAAPPKKKKLDKRQLWMELPAFLTFFLMFVLSLNTRRIVTEQYFMINAVRTALYDENFGDFNEKAFSDIANFEEMFDWLDGVFVPGLFPEETLAGEEVTKTDIGNVAMYNKLVGAIRIRQARRRRSWRLVMHACICVHVRARACTRVVCVVACGCRHRWHAWGGDQRGGHVATRPPVARAAPACASRCISLHLVASHPLAGAHPAQRRVQPRGDEPPHDGVPKRLDLRRGLCGRVLRPSE